MLATEIIDYPWNAICMLAEELNVKIYRKEPKNKKVWLVLGMLMEWEGKRRKDDESAKKVLARNMIKLDSMWTVDDQIVDFKKLARKLDIQGNLHAMPTDHNFVYKIEFQFWHWMK